MRTPNEFSITKCDRRLLKGWLRSTTMPQGPVTRAKIVLSLSERLTPSEVAEAQHVSCKTVHKWRNRFIEAGPDGLLDHSRPGRPRLINDKTVNRVMERQVCMQHSISSRAKSLARWPTVPAQKNFCRFSNSLTEARLRTRTYT